MYKIDEIVNKLIKANRVVEYDFEELSEISKNEGNNDFLTCVIVDALDYLIEYEMLNIDIMDFLNGDIKQIAKIDEDLKEHLTCSFRNRIIELIKDDFEGDLMAYQRENMTKNEFKDEFFGE